MPVKIAENLPAKGILESENIFVMGEERASHQDIRPLKIVIMNIMPTKISTETQLLRVLGNTSLQIDVSFMHPISHTSKNTPIEHLKSFYQYFDEIKQQRFDGMIVTGAPVELLPFEEVDYWKELTEIMDWAKKNVFSTFYICWGAQAGLHHFYDIPKYPLPQKMFGVFPHTIKQQHVKLLRGFDDIINAPHSRHTEIRREDIEKCSDLDILVESEEAGIYIVASKDGRQVFVTGHSEYDPLTLKAEYDRDFAKGLDIQVPRNYYPNDDPTREPLVTWRAHANLLYSNWLNYYVYQETPYDLNELQ